MKYHRTVDEGLKLLSKYVIPIALMDLKLREDWKVEINQEKKQYHIQLAGKDIFFSQSLIRATSPEKVETLVDKLKAVIISEVDINIVLMVGENR